MCKGGKPIIQCASVASLLLWKGLSKFRDSVFGFVADNRNGIVQNLNHAAASGCWIRAVQTLGKSHRGHWRERQGAYSDITTRHSSFLGAFVACHGQWGQFSCFNSESKASIVLRMADQREWLRRFQVISDETTVTTRVSFMQISGNRLSS